MKPEKDIYQALVQNRLITLSSVVLCIISVLGALIYSYAMHQQAMKQILMVNAEGEIVPTRQSSRKEVLEIEIQDFLNDWFQAYYTYDANNLDSQREKGLWLIAGDDGKNLERYYAESGWLNEVKRYNLIQETTLLPKSVKITYGKDAYGFQAVALMVVKRGLNVQEYYLRTSGYLMEVSRSFPENPHGLMIMKYQFGELEKKESKQ